MAEVKINKRKKSNEFSIPQLCPNGKTMVTEIKITRFDWGFIVCKAIFFDDRFHHTDIKKFKLTPKYPTHKVQYDRMAKYCKVQFT